MARILFFLMFFFTLSAVTPVSAAPSTNEFIGALSACALNLKIKISANLLGSITSLYDGKGAKGTAMLEQKTDFLDLFPQADRKSAYELYSICVQSVLDPTNFDPFILNKFVVNKTNISFVEQRLGQPSTDEPSEFRKGNIAVFPVGGYDIEIYYFPNAINGKDDDGEIDAEDLHLPAGTISAISVSADPDEKQRPLVFSGYWVWFGCDGEADCRTWGSKKRLGEMKLSDLAGGECQPLATGGYVGWNQEPSRMVLWCSGSHGASVAFSCSLTDEIGTMADILFQKQEVIDRKAEGNVEAAQNAQDTIATLRSLLPSDESTYRSLFWKTMNDCTVSEYAIFGDNISPDALFVGSFHLNFEN